RLHAIGLGERLADGIEQPRVRGRVAPPGAADRRLVDRDDTCRGGDRAVDQRTLPRARHAGDDDKDAEGNVDVDVLQIVRRRVADLQLVGRLPDGVLELRPVVDRKSTRLNSSHVKISYAVFCLKKKKK